MITKTKPTTKKRAAAAAAKRTTKSKRSQSENRAAERTKFVVAATVYPDRLSPDNLSHKVWITNISLGGVAFRTRRKYEAGTSCYIRVDAGIVKFDNPLKIIWCNRRDENTFEVGCELLPD
jgi:hypothetical protein